MTLKEEEDLLSTFHSYFYINMLIFILLKMKLLVSLETTPYKYEKKKEMRNVLLEGIAIFSLNIHTYMLALTFDYNIS